MSTLRAVAASSFSDLLPAIARRCGIPIEIRYGANTVLHRQLRDGLPVDLLFSADANEMTALLRERVLFGKPLIFARNVLEVVVRRKAGLSRGLEHNLENWTVTQRIAIGRVETTASGREARRTWGQSGHWERIQPKLVQTSTVRQARALLLRGDVDSAVLFRSDRMSSGESLRSLGVLPGSTPLSCACAVVENSPRRAEAMRFMDALQTADVRRIVQQQGFLKP